MLRQAVPCSLTHYHLSCCSGPGLLPAFQRSLRLGGRSALLLRLLLGALSSRVSSGSAAGAAPGRIGGEFVAARLAAEALDAQIVLGEYRASFC